MTTAAAQFEWTGRANRVRRLLVIILLLSAFDLAATTLHMQSTGMLESNPVVLALVQHTGSASALAIFKALTVFSGTALLHLLRRHRTTEAGAWLGAIVLVVVTGMWISYERHTADLDIVDWARIAEADPNWVSLRAL